jgi:hypothetical protein
MKTSDKTGACYTGLNGATVLSEVRTISGLPSHMLIIVLLLLISHPSGCRRSHLPQGGEKFQYKYWI